MRKKLAGLAVAAVTGAAVVGAGAAFAAGSGGDDHQATEAGYHVCINPDSTIKHNAIWPNDAAHPLVCHNGSQLYSWLSKQNVNGHFRTDEAALAAVAASVGNLKDALASATDPSLHVMANGPYPGTTVLKYGSNSTAVWAGDSGAHLQTSWVACPEGSVALGGGFEHGDQANLQNEQVITSAPAQIKDGEFAYTPIDGNPDGALVPNAWKVEGYNNGTTDLQVRPWVVCSVASQTPPAAQ